MTLFFIFLKHELLCMGRNYSKIIQVILFFIMSCFVFLLISQSIDDAFNRGVFFKIIIWISMLYSFFISSSFLWKQDFEDGSIEQFISACENLEIYTASKMVANWLVFLLPIAVIAIMVNYLGGSRENEAQSFFCSLILSTVAINFICGFCSVLEAASNRAFLLAIIAMPLTLPIILLSFIGANDLLFGIAVISILLSCFLSAYIIKIIAE